MSEILQDAVYACRTLRRAPALIATAVLSLGLGIATTTTVFSFVNAVQFKRLPFVEPDSLVDVQETSATALCAGCAVGTSYPTLADWRSQARSFAAVGAFEEARMIVSGGGDPERIPGGLVSAGLFLMLGIQPALGRNMTADDDRPGAEPVALLSDQLWRRRFNADRAVLGATLKINGAAHTIVGVMPPGFRFPEYAQFWVPLAPERHDQGRGERSLSVIARLLPGIDLSVAAAEMRAIAAGIAAGHKETNGPWSVRVRALHEAMTAEAAAPSAVVLGAVAFVLLIACANVSNLLLVRASERQREISIRIAIGSTRSRIARLVLIESLTLAVAGGLLGLTIALWANRAAIAAFGELPPYWIQLSIDWRVFAFCAAITLGTAVAFGLAPALHASRYEPQAVLKEGGGATAGRRSRRIAGALVMAQISLALLLLAGAGLLVKTVVRWAAHDPGFDPARVLEGDVSLPASAYATPASINAFASGLMERLTGLPNTRAGIQRVVFFAGFGAQARQVTVEGTASVPEGASPSFYFAVTPGFFLMLGAPLTEGREFGPYDGSDVAIVNQAMARAIWGSASPLGRRIRFGDRPWRTVVGVAGNINGGIRPYPSAYVPFSSEPGPDLAVMISTSGNPSSLAGDLRAAVRAIDSDQPIESVMTLAAMRREQSAPSRYVALLMSALSIVAVGLASVGLYGVTAYAVRRRLRECGVRIALGATASDIVRLIVGSTWRMIAPGLLLGIGAAWAGTRALRGILFGTSPTDPAVFATTVVILAAVASFASYLPARRAARVDPMAALRDA